MNGKWMEILNYAKKVLDESTKSATKVLDVFMKMWNVLFWMNVHYKNVFLIHFAMKLSVGRCGYHLF